MEWNYTPTAALRVFASMAITDFWDLATISHMATLGYLLLGTTFVERPADP